MINGIVDKKGKQNETSRHTRLSTDTNLHKTNIRTVCNVTKEHSEQKKNLTEYRNKIMFMHILTGH